MATEPPTAMELIKEIEAKLKRIEDAMSFMIRAGQRFKKGQRVRFSSKAVHASIVTKKRKDVRGTVTQVGRTFTMMVKLDDRKHASCYHHSFFDPVKQW